MDVFFGAGIMGCSSTVAFGSEDGMMSRSLMGGRVVVLPVGGATSESVVAGLNARAGNLSMIFGRPPSVLCLFAGLLV